MIERLNWTEQNFLLHHKLCLWDLIWGQCTERDFPGDSLVKNLPAHAEDLLENKMETYSSILAWEIPGTEKPGGLQSKGLQKARYNWEHTSRYREASFWQHFHYHITSLFKQLKKITSFKFEVSVAAKLGVPQATFHFLKSIFFLSIFSWPATHFGQLNLAPGRMWSGKSGPNSFSLVFLISFPEAGVYKTHQHPHVNESGTLWLQFLVPRACRIMGRHDPGPGHPSWVPGVGTLLWHLRDNSECWKAKWTHL